MMPPAPSAAEFSTVFDWTSPGSRKLSLLSFVAASAALHALCFYVFQIIYPPTAAPPRPPARVNIITPASEEGRVLLRWIEAEDPAISSTTQRPPGKRAFVPPKPAYVPSYVNRQPALREPPPFEPDLRVPSSRPPAPVERPRVSMPAAAPLVPTSVRFSVEMELGAPVLPALQFTASNNEPPQVAQFRLALSARGEVRYCFLQELLGRFGLGRPGAPLPSARSIPDDRKKENRKATPATSGLPRSSSGATISRLLRLLPLIPRAP